MKCDSSSQQNSIRFFTCCFILLISFSLHSQTSYVWANTAGLQSFDQGTDVKRDGTGDVYTVGSFSGTIDFDPSASVYNLSSNNLDGFIAKYNSSGNLIWAARLSGTQSISNLKLAIANNGDIFVAGTANAISSVDFDPSASSSMASPASGNLFLARYTSAGVLLWARAGGGYVSSVNMDLNFSGNDIVLTGAFAGNSVDMDLSSGSYTVGGNSFGDTYSYIAKYSSTGTLQWAGSIGVSFSSVEAYDVRFDPSGNIFLGGRFNSASAIDFDFTAGTYTIIATGGQGYDAFIAKYNSNGTINKAIAYGQSANWSGIESCRSMDFDAAGNVYITGEFASPADFDPTIATYTVSSGGSGSDIYFGKYDNNLNVMWVKGIGSSSNELSSTIRVDSYGYVYASGIFYGTLDFDPGAATFNLNNSGNSDIYVTFFDNAGNFQEAIKIAGSQEDRANVLALNNAGDFYLTGYFSSANTDFDPQSGTVNKSYSTNYDYFVARYTVPFITILPTGITSFNAVPDNNNNSVNLDWKLENKTNENVFEVQRSTDATNFQTIAVLEFSEKTDDHFYYKDNQPLNGTSYYRIKQRTKNGAEFSEIREVNFTLTERISVFPNPSNGTFRLNGISNQAQLKLFNNEGKEVIFQLNENEVVTNNLNEGIYLLQINSQTNKKTETIKVLITSGQ